MQVEQSRTRGIRTARQSAIAPTAREHFVQFYERDAALVASVAEFIGAGFESDASAIVVATSDHLQSLEQRLAALRIDVAAARAADRLVALDARQTVDSLLVEGWPDADRFAALIEPRIAHAQKRVPRIVVFGEMVALLWRDGRHEAAVRLEELWNDLARKYDFSLFCAYPIAQMEEGSWEAVHAVCAAHSHAMPANAVAHASEEKRLAEICDLKRRGRALDAEIGGRRLTEQLLARSNRELDDFRERTLQVVRALHESEERAEHMRALLAAIVESSEDAIVSESLDGRITSWNAGARRLFGHSAEDALGRPMTMIIPPELRHEEVHILERLAKGERIEHFETVRIANDGRRIDVSLTISPVRDRNGRVVGASKVARDVSERKRMEAQLRDADHRKDEFIAMLGHELRNPLAPIRNAAAVLRRTSANETSVELCRMLERQVQQMTRLIDDLLDVGRITRGVIRFRRERMDFADAVTRAVEMSEPLLSRRRQRLRVELPREPLPLDGDRARLTQMIVNLLDNAAKYTPEGGIVSLQVRLVAAGLVELRVQDNGIGISPEMLPTIFGLFVQARRPGTDGQEGLGIGLALVRMIAEHHGGGVAASSAGAGKGSAFVVRLPAAPGPGRHHPFG